MGMNLLVLVRIISMCEGRRRGSLDDGNEYFQGEIRCLVKRNGRGILDLGRKGFKYSKQL